MEVDTPEDGHSSTASETGGGNTACSTRLQRNLAEKQRRDRYNGHINELAALVPMVVNASKPQDKCSTMRLSASHLRINLSCLAAHNFKSRINLVLPPEYLHDILKIEKSVGGFILATMFDGMTLFCSENVEEYTGFQDIDLLGASLYNFIEQEERCHFKRTVDNLIRRYEKALKKPEGNKKPKTLKKPEENEKPKDKDPPRIIVQAPMLVKPQPRSHEIRHERMIFELTIFKNNTQKIEKNSTEHKGKMFKLGKQKDFGLSAVVLMFVHPAPVPNPDDDLFFVKETLYVTVHGINGEIKSADSRISMITGYLPEEVVGKSAYEYIFSPDIQIALFAQNAMFASNDGTGHIIYRLLKCDATHIYLLTQGQTIFKNGTQEIDYFQCVNRLLSDTEGEIELEKFKERFAPKITGVQPLKKSILSQSMHDFDVCVPSEPMLQEPIVAKLESCDSNCSLLSASRAFYSQQNMEVDTFSKMDFLPMNEQALMEKVSQLLDPTLLGLPLSPGSNGCSSGDNIPNNLEMELGLLADVFRESGLMGNGLGGGFLNSSDEVLSSLQFVPNDACNKAINSCCFRRDSGLGLNSCYGCEQSVSNKPPFMNYGNFDIALLDSDSPKKQPQYEEFGSTGNYHDHLAAAVHSQNGIQPNFSYMNSTNAKTFVHAQNLSELNLSESGLVPSAAAPSVLTHSWNDATSPKFITEQNYCNGGFESVNANTEIFMEDSEGQRFNRVLSAVPLHNLFDNRYNGLENNKSFSANHGSAETCVMPLPIIPQPQKKNISIPSYDNAFPTPSNGLEENLGFFKLNQLYEAQDITMNSIDHNLQSHHHNSFVGNTQGECSDLDAVFNDILICPSSLEQNVFSVAQGKNGYREVLPPIGGNGGFEVGNFDWNT